jgi:hypothetical protein
MRGFFRRFISLVLIVINCGCIKNQSINWMQGINIPKSDIVYQTIDENLNSDYYKKDLLGFYSLIASENSLLDLGLPLLTPFYFRGNEIISFYKLGNPGNVNDYSGNIIIFTSDGYLWCDKPEATGWWLQPFQDNVLLSSEDGINLIDGDDCSLIKTIINQKQLVSLTGTKYLTPFSLSSDGKFMVISSDYRLFRINLVDLNSFDIVEYRKTGTNPSISPDPDGIHIMDIDGNEDRLIVYYLAYKDQSHEILKGVLPKPQWSDNSSMLVYHKCINFDTADYCMDVNDYLISIYYLVDQTERQLIINGINPSWRQ